MSEPLLDFISHIQQNFKLSNYLGLEGTIDGQTYNPKAGTVHLVVGEAFSDFDDQDTTPYEIIGTLTTDQIGHQVGPWGGERALAIPTRGGWRIMMTHGEDDTGVSDAPGAPSGEHWLLHAKKGTVGAEYTVPPTWDSGWKVTADGATPGDGLGGTSVGYQGALTQQITKAGRVVQLDDTNQVVQTSTPGGMTGTYSDVLLSIVHSASAAVFSSVNATTQQIKLQTATTTYSLIDAVVKQITHQAGSNVFTQIDAINQLIMHQASAATLLKIDAAGQAISHLIPSGGSINLGALAGAGSLIPAISKTDMSTLIGDTSVGINIQRWVDLVFTMKAMLNAMAVSGVPSLPGIAAIVSEMSTQFGTTVPGLSSLPSWSSILVPSGSAHVNLIP